MELSSGNLSSIILTRAAAHSLRLLQTRKVGPTTFSTTLNGLAIKAYPEREGAYYSQGLEYIRHLEVCCPCLLVYIHCET